MARFRQHADALAKTEDELRAEAASSLSRVAGVIERTLEELLPLDARLKSASYVTPEEAEAHRTLRKRAETYLWYLVVQREAIGLRNHDDVYERYAVPGPLRK